MLRDFVTCLALRPRDGKFLFHWGASIHESQLEYVCLNPATILSRLCQMASKVIFASGTLEPAGDFALLKEPLHSFSCGHIVSPSNFIAVGFANFDFRFEYRKGMLPRMASLVAEVREVQCKTTGGGIICFVQSY